MNTSLFNRVNPSDVTRISFTRGMGEDERVFTNGVDLTQPYSLIEFWTRKKRYNLAKMSKTLKDTLLVDQQSYPPKSQPYTWDFTKNEPLQYTPLAYMVSLYEWNGERGRISNISVYKIRDLENYEVIKGQGDPMYTWHWNSWLININLLDMVISEVFYA